MGIVDNRIILFLFFAFVTGVIYLLRRQSITSLGDAIVVVLDFLLVPAALVTVALFFSIITRTDPLPLLREAGYQLGLRQLVAFDNAIPAHLQSSLDVADVKRLDTDGDDFNEWVVFYQYDLQDGRSPVKGVIYDNDRGDPPVIFPYHLQALDRDYLSEGPVSISFADITDGVVGPDGRDIPEILIAGANSLSIFRFNENSAEWDFPRDAPRRYEVIGTFRGSGGVTFDPATNHVIVLNRDGFERSQLAIRTVYALNEVTGTYLDTFTPDILAAPIVSTIDFYLNPPADIYQTTYPEKIVLAFYAAACAQQDETLCHWYPLEWEAAQFLAAEALAEYQNGNAAFFGLNSFGVGGGLSVVDLRYYPQLETDADLLVSGQGRDVVTGEEPRYNVVDLKFVVGGGPVESRRYVMEQIEGRWKITGRLPEEAPVLGMPGGPTTPQ